MLSERPSCPHSVSASSLEHNCKEQKLGSSSFHSQLPLLVPVQQSEPRYYEVSLLLVVVFGFGLVETIMRHGVLAAARGDESI